MTVSNNHFQYSEIELENMKSEFNQLQTINEKFDFWKDRFNISYALWGLVLINGYVRNLEIIPKNDEETQILINLILKDALPFFQRRNNLRINVMKEQFIKQIESSTNKESIVKYESSKIDSLVLPKRQTPMADPDKYERDLYFVRGFENYLFYKKEFEQYQHIIAGYLLVEFYNGVQLAKYREFVESYLNQEKSKPEVRLNGEQKFLVLHYLGFGNDLKANTHKSVLFDFFIEELKASSIRPMLSDVKKYETEENLYALLSFFKFIKLNSKASEIQAKIDKLKKKR